MKWKPILIFVLVIVILSITMIIGCTDKNNVVQSISYDNIWYSLDNETVLLYVSSSISDQTLVDTIDELYDNGYEYVGDVQIPYNYTGRVDFYLLFRIKE